MGEAIRALAQLGVAGWPLGLALAAVATGDRLREARRRAALNRALHELRRPVQALVLSSERGPGTGPDAIRITLAALDDLDRAINGGRRSFAPRAVSCRALVESAVERWRGLAAAAHCSLNVGWRAGPAIVLADPDRVAQALDNLIDNAIRHGGLRVSVHATVGAGGVRITVADSGGRRGRGRSAPDRRHGHGLRVVSAVAREHGGRFAIEHSAAGTRAVLELPLAPAPLPVARLAVAGTGDAVPVDRCGYPTPFALEPGGGAGEAEHAAGGS